MDERRGAFDPDGASRRSSRSLIYFVITRKTPNIEQTAVAILKASVIDLIVFSDMSAPGIKILISLNVEVSQ